MFISLWSPRIQTWYFVLAISHMEKKDLRLACLLACESSDFFFSQRGRYNSSNDVTAAPLRSQAPFSSILILVGTHKLCLLFWPRLFTLSESRRQIVRMFWFSGDHTKWEQSLFTFSYSVSWDPTYCRWSQRKECIRALSFITGALTTLQLKQLNGSIILAKWSPHV